VIADTIGNIFILASSLLGVLTNTLGFSTSEWFNILKGAGLLWSFLNIVR